MPHNWYVKTKAKRPVRLTVRPAIGSLKDIDEMRFHRPKGLKPGDLDRALKWTKRDVLDKGLIGKKYL